MAGGWPEGPAPDWGGGPIGGGAGCGVGLQEVGRTALPPIGVVEGNQGQAGWAGRAVGQSGWGSRSGTGPAWGMGCWGVGRGPCPPMGPVR